MIERDNGGNVSAGGTIGVVGSGAQALVVNGSETLACTRTCNRERDGECQGAWRCTPENRCGNVACRANSDCAAGFTCDVASNRCLAAPLPGVGEIGAPCTGETSCRGGVCFTPTNTGGVTTWREGYCTTGCTGLAGGGDTCPAGSYCSTRNVGALGFCLKLCDAMPGNARFGACRAGYMCRAFQGDARTGLCLDGA
jgi:hypothetical protein